jgi:GNAT superfamily N-acetyltransferase
MPIDWDDVVFAFERPAEISCEFDRATGEIVYDGEVKADDLVYIPLIDSATGWRWMEAFVATVSGRRLCERPEVAINGRGAFRRFRDALDGPELERWYAFREERLREHVYEWAIEHGIDVADFPWKVAREAEPGGLRYADGADVDVDDVAALFDAVGWKHRTADPERLERMLGGSALAVQAWDGDALVGFARALSDDAFNAYISTVAVLPAYRRQGIGTELVKRLMAGQDELTFALNARDAAGFYAKLGFEPATTMMRRVRKG